MDFNGNQTVQGPKDSWVSKVNYSFNCEAKCFII